MKCIYLQTAVVLTVLFLCSCTVPESSLFTTRGNLEFTSEIKDLEFKEVIFPAADGVRLYGWYLPGSDNRQIILFFHGTDTNISRLTRRLKTLNDLNVCVFVFDYRGFGRSEGEPTESGTYQDARGALDFLQRIGWTPDRIVYFGHSLGAAVALQLALEKTPAGLVLESPFTSIPDLVRYHHPLIFAALSWVLPPFYNNRSKIGDINTPLMIFHGKRDRKVPPDMSRSLYSMAAEPKILHLVPEAGHDNVPVAGGDKYLNEWKAFLVRVATQQKKISSPTLSPD